MPKVIVFIIMLLSFMLVIVFIIVLKFRSHPTEGIEGAQLFFPSIFWINFHLLQGLNMVKPVSASNTTSCCNFSSKKNMQ